VPGVPVHIRLNPVGDALVGYDGSRFRCWRADGDGWHEPELLTDEAGGNTESGCPSMAFSSDGRLLLSNGQLFTAALEPAGWVDLPGASLVGLGWLAGYPALAWRELRSRPDPKYEGLTEHYWTVGIQRQRAAKEVEETQHEAHSGIVMSGRHLFDERRDRVIRLAPPRHGSGDMTAEILRLEEGSLHLEAQTEGLSLARLARLEGDALLLAASSGRGSEGGGGIQVIDAATLEERRRITLPADLFGDFDSIHDVCLLEEEHLLVSTFTTLARVRVDGGVGTTEHVFNLTHVRALDARAGRAVAATDWELVELVGNDARPLPLPDF
jgi:hypothetical protein